MKLEQKDRSFLFSNTEIPDLFFSEYLSNSSGDFIKVYLYILFLSKYNKEIKLNDLSKKLALPLKTIHSAMDYWEELGLVTKKTSGYILNDIQEIELHKIYSPKLSSSPEQTLKNNKNKYRAKAIETINTSCFQGMMSNSWYIDIDLWFNKYHFDEQVMISLFNYCLERSALHKNYVQTVADSWSKNNIKTYTDLENYYHKFETLNKMKKLISKKLGLSRSLTQYESAYIEKWIIDFSYSIDIIEIALKRTTSKANPNFEYLNKLLSDWYDRGFKTSSEIQTFLTDMKKKTKDIKTLEKKNSYSNYDQRNYDNLDSLYANN